MTKISLNALSLAIVFLTTLLLGLSLPSMVVGQVANDLPPVPRGLQVQYVGQVKSLLEKDGLGAWEKIDFAGGGETTVESSVMTIDTGDMLSGVYWDGDEDELPKNNYELSMEARRTGGIDFFCGPVFPVNDSHLALIVGGWAGATVGLSNLDNEDASRNESNILMAFDDQRWYQVKIRVLPDRVLVWIDGNCVVYQNIVGKKLSLRGETDFCTPLGLCTFSTKAEIRKIALRRFKPIDSKGPAIAPATSEAEGESDGR